MKRDIEIDSLRITATLMVVFLHLSGSYIDTSLKFDFSFWVANLIQGFTRICVPLFIMISGKYLLNDEFANVNDFFKKRLYKIVLPFLFWVTVYSLFKSILLYNDSNHEYAQIFIDAIAGNAFYHLWYLYMIIPLLAMTPIIVKIKNKIGIKTFTVLGVIFFIISISITIVNILFEISEFWIFWFIKYLGYYIFGYLIGNGYIKAEKSRLIPMYIIGSISISLLSYVWISFGWGQYWYFYTNPLVIITALAFFSFFVNHRTMYNKWTTSLSAYTFGVYLIHPLMLEILRKFRLIRFTGIIIIDLIIAFILCMASTTFIVSVFRKHKLLRQFV